ncbi:hypothetical protein N8772_02690, partial [Rickettsiales bacterium]|nr:hypothetical protein [Rickettsiales bacterium]
MTKINLSPYIKQYLSKGNNNPSLELLLEEAKKDIGQTYPNSGNNNEEEGLLQDCNYLIDLSKRGCLKTETIICRKMHNSKFVTTQGQQYSLDTSKLTEGEAKKAKEVLKNRFEEVNDRYQTSFEEALSAETPILRPARSRQQRTNMAGLGVILGVLAVAIRGNHFGTSWLSSLPIGQEGPDESQTLFSIGSSSNHGGLQEESSRNNLRGNVRALQEDLSPALGHLQGIFPNILDSSNRYRAVDGVVVFTIEGQNMLYLINDQGIVTQAANNDNIPLTSITSCNNGICQYQSYPRPGN